MSRHTKGFSSKQARNHVKDRAEERLGLDLTDRQIKDIAKQIKSGGAEFIRRRSNRVSRWRVFVGEDCFQVLYDCERHIVLSCFPDKDHETIIALVNKFIDEANRANEFPDKSRYLSRAPKRLRPRLMENLQFFEAMLDIGKLWRSKQGQ